VQSAPSLDEFACPECGESGVVIYDLDPAEEIVGKDGPTGFEV
jgi:hypothetical protein